MFVAGLIGLGAAGVWLAAGVSAAVLDWRGPNRLEVPLGVESEAISEVFYDRGFGTRQEDAMAVPVGPAAMSGGMRLAVFSLPRVEIKGFRFDPIALPGRFAVGEPRLVTASGREIARLPLAAIRAQYDIAELRREGDRLVGVTPPGGLDPQLALELPQPWGPGEVQLPWAAAGVFLGLTVVVGWFGRAGVARWWWEVLRRAGNGPWWEMTARRVALGGVVVAGVELWLLWPLHRTLDWPIWDEANYAAIGAAWAKQGDGLGELHSAPLYVASYGLWSHLGGLAAAIFAQHYFVKLATTVLLYLVLARWWRSWIAAAAVAVAWGATNFQTEFPLLVYQGAWVWFLAALVLVDHWPAAGLGLTVLALCGRQEYQFAAAVLAGWLAWRAWRGRSGRGLVATGSGGRELVVGAALAVIVWGAAGAVLGKTSFSGGGGRAWFAFQQHYAVRAAETGEAKGINPWVDYPRVMEKDFGGARSLSDAWKANAAGVVRHVGYNLRRAPVEIAKLGEAHAGLGLAAGLLVAAGAVGLLASARGGKNRESGAVPASVVLAAAGLVAVAPGMLVAAKGAYLLAVVPAVVGGTGWLVRKVGGRERRIAGVAVVLAAAGLVVLAMAPRVFVAGERSRPVADTVTALAARWPAGGRAVLLGAGASSYAHYLGDERCQGVEPFSEVSGTAGGSASLEELLARLQPRAVLVTGDWRSSSRFDEKEIARLLAAPVWERQVVPAGEVFWRVEGEGR